MKDPRPDETLHTKKHPHRFGSCHKGGVLISKEVEDNGLVGVLEDAGIEVRQIPQINPGRGQ